MSGQFLFGVKLGLVQFTPPNTVCPPFACMPRRVFVPRARNADGYCCTSQFDTAHGIVFREVYYPWHPWFGQLVAVHSVVEKAPGLVFRCTLNGLAATRWLEIPAWMFERTSCPLAATLADQPWVGIPTLLSLQVLLASTTKVVGSEPGFSRLSLTSRNNGGRQSGVDQHEKPGAQGVCTERERSSAGPVWRSPRPVADGNADLVGPSQGNAGNADPVDGATDPGACVSSRRPRATGGRP